MTFRDLPTCTRSSRIRGCNRARGRPVSEARSIEEAEPAYASRLAQLSDGDWHLLDEALRRVDSADSFGTWTDSVLRDDGSWLMPYAALSTECDDFLRTLAGLGLHIPFDWSAWEYGRVLAEVPERLDHATPAEAAMVIFAIWRSDRFVEGALLDGFESGLIQHAARRMLSAGPRHEA